MSNTQKNSNDTHFMELQYQILSERRINHNTLLWNTPSLLFVAQALLWNLSLNKDTNLFICCCLSATSILIGYASLQTFRQNRLMEIADAEQLYSIENTMIENKNPLTLAIHHKIGKRTILLNGKYFKLSTRLNPVTYMKSHSSFKVWEFTLRIMLILSITIFIYNIGLTINNLFHLI